MSPSKVDLFLFVRTSACFLLASTSCASVSCNSQAPPPVLPSLVSCAVLHFLALITPMEE